MEYDLQLKIYKDKKLANYLKEHSQWYKYLNRNSANYKLFLSDFKKFNRGEHMGKINNAIDTLGIINSIFKTLD